MNVATKLVRVERGQTTASRPQDSAFPLLGPGPHTKPADAVAQEIGSDAARGLNRAEAKHRLEQYGPNELEIAPETPLWKRLLEQFQNVLIIVLLVAIVISVIEWTLQDPRETPLPYEAIVITAIVPPLKGGSGLGIPSAPAVLFPDGAVLMPSIAACERLQGFARGWTSAAERESKRARWRLLGNSVSVPVAAWVASRVASPGIALPLPMKALVKGSRWPNAAFNVGAGRFAVEATDRPLDRSRPSIQAFRDAGWTPLSERALNGFITRATEGGLRFPRGFLSALRAAHRRSRIAA